MRAFDTQDPAVSQVLIFHLFRRVKEVIFAFSEHSDCLTDLVMLFDVFDDMGVVERRSSNTVED